MSGLNDLPHLTGVRDGPRRRAIPDDAPCPLCGADAIHWTRAELAAHACDLAARVFSTEVGARFLGARLLGLCWDCAGAAVEVGRLLDAVAALAREEPC